MHADISHPMDCPGASNIVNRHIIPHQWSDDEVLSCELPVVSNFDLNMIEIEREI